MTVNANESNTKQKNYLQYFKEFKAGAESEIKIIHCKYTIVQ